MVSLISLVIVFISCAADIVVQFFSFAINLNPSFTFSKNFIPSDSILSGINFSLRKTLSSAEISRKIVRSGYSP